MNMKKQPIKILGEEINPKYYPNLYRMAKTNPEGLAEQLQSIANAWHEGSIVSAMQALESDLAHG